MNGLGLAGVELHGVIGYDILARYRITYDFTADTLAFVPLDFTPPAIQGIGGKGQGGLEVLGPIMKTLAAFMGIKPGFDVAPRGQVGIEVEEKDEHRHYSERSYGSFSRSLTLPGDASDDVKAKFVDGVLMLTIPKAEERKPRVVRIES